LLTGLVNVELPWPVQQNVYGPTSCWFKDVAAFYKTCAGILGRCDDT